MAILLYCYMAILLYGYMVIWLYGYMVIWLYGYMVILPTATAYCQLLSCIQYPIMQSIVNSHLGHSLGLSYPFIRAYSFA